MKDLLHSRFIQTVLSADMSTEPTEAMEYYQEFYMAATSLLSGDWRTAGLEYSTVIIHLNLKRRGYAKSSLSELSCFLRSLAEREGFEPPEPFSSTVFKTAVIDHSTTSPIFHKAGKPPYRVLFPKRTAKIIKNLVSANYFCFSRLLSFLSPSFSGFLSSTRKNLYWNAIR